MGPSSWSGPAAAGAGPAGGIPPSAEQLRGLSRLSAQDFARGPSLGWSLMGSKLCQEVERGHMTICNIVTPFWVIIVLVFVCLVCFSSYCVMCV